MMMRVLAYHVQFDVSTVVIDSFGDSIIHLIPRRPVASFITRYLSFNTTPYIRVLQLGTPEKKLHTTDLIPPTPSLIGYATTQFRPIHHAQLKAFSIIPDLGVISVFNRDRFSFPFIFRPLHFLLLVTCHIITP